MDNLLLLIITTCVCFFIILVASIISDCFTSIISDCFRSKKETTNIESEFIFTQQNEPEVEYMPMYQSKQEINKMTINEFAKEVTLQEGLKKSINVAQVKEVLRIVNKLLNNQLYKLIKKL
jgi:hypothetical protein